MENIRIAVASGKGGTGKTLVATNLFFSLTEKGIDAVLIDCDAEAPDAALFFQKAIKSVKPVNLKVPSVDEQKCTFCGRCYEFCNYNAVFYIPDLKVIRILEDLCHGCGACLYACNSDAIVESDKMLGEITEFSLNSGNVLVEARMKTGVYSPVKVIKEGIGSVLPGRPVIMDAPPGTSCPFVQTTGHADFVLLVTEPTPFGLSDLKQSVEVLKLLGKPCGVVVNRAGYGNSDVYGYLSEEKIPLLMEIPFDRNIARVTASGKLISDIDNMWQRRFVSLFEKIVEIYGNGNNKR